MKSYYKVLNDVTKLEILPGKDTGYLNLVNKSIENIHLNNVKYQFISLNTNKINQIRITNCKIISLNLSYNNLTDFKSYWTTKQLFISNNNLKSLILNKNLIYLNCSNNLLKELVLNKKLTQLEIYNNPGINLIIPPNTDLKHICTNCYFDKLPLGLSQIKLSN
jgi:hypothetical protein